jgi:hypothetical protein
MQSFPTYINLEKRNHEKSGLKNYSNCIKPRLCSSHLLHNLGLRIQQGLDDREHLFGTAIFNDPQILTATGFLDPYEQGDLRYGHPTQEYITLCQGIS